MTDFRALCAELVEKLDELNCHYNVPSQSTMIERARAALAEPVAEWPTDTQLIEEAIAVGLAFQPQDEVEEVFLPFDAEEPLDEELIAFARAVLARWGCPAPVPTEGEVAELVAWLRETGDLACQADAEEGQRYWSAAELLQRQTLVPVPVSERLPGPEDCDAEGRCWFLRFPFDYSRESWSLEDRTYGCNIGFTHWLPATALPLPGQEVEG